MSLSYRHPSVLYKASATGFRYCEFRLHLDWLIYLSTGLGVLLASNVLLAGLPDDYVIDMSNEGH